MDFNYINTSQQAAYSLSFLIDLLYLKHYLEDWDASEQPLKFTLALGNCQGVCWGKSVFSLIFVGNLFAEAKLS